MFEKVHGLIAAAFTPMKSDGSLDLEKVSMQGNHMSKQGVSGVLVGGTTGESLSLTKPERMELAEAWIHHAPKNLRVMIHVGCECSRDAADLASHAQKIGAAGIATMAPSFFTPSIDGLVDYCARIGSGAPKLPMYFYHIPSMTGCHMAVADFLEAAADRIPNLAGVKFTFEDLKDFQICSQICDGRFDMLFGRDEMLLGGLAFGSRGAIGSTYNYLVAPYLRIIEAFENGDIQTARRVQGDVNRFIRVLGKLGGGVVAGKAIMKLLDMDLGPVREPLQTIEGDALENLRQALQDVGFFEMI